jgi:ketopantoate reductase
MRIAIFGTGGAGGYFGALLARAGEDVVSSPAVRSCRRSARQVCGLIPRRARS